MMDIKLTKKELVKKQREQEHKIKKYFKLKTLKEARAMIENSEERLLGLDRKTLKSFGLTKSRKYEPVLPNPERRVQKFFGLKNKKEARQMIENSDERLLALNLEQLKKLGLNKFNEPEKAKEDA